MKVVNLQGITRPIEIIDSYQVVQEVLVVLQEFQWETGRQLKLSLSHVHPYRPCRPEIQFML